MPRPDHSADLVRAYRTTDRQAVHFIAAETAFFGTAAEAYLDDRRILSDAVYGYYTDFESEHVLIAEHESQPVGFLTGCYDTVRQLRIWRRLILPKLALSVVTGRYYLGRRTLRYAVSAIRAVARNEIPAADLHLYPAHLHVNIMPAARGLGLGERLLVTYLNQLWRDRIAGVHLHTTSLNIAACHLYRKAGMQLLSSRATLLWAGFTPERVENRLYGLRFTPERSP
jgi:ribosomal protein S18 acetylase RimI-like enzyme